MQTAFRITDGSTGTAYHQRNRMHRHQQGDKRQEEKKTAASRHCNGFLTGRILPVAPDYFINQGMEENIRITSEENFDFLYRSALRYTQLMGVQFPFKKSRDSMRINFINLYQALDNALPENINMEIMDGKPHFCLYRFHEWPDYTLFWIPLDFTETLPRQLKKITLEFLQRFVRHHDIQDVTDTCYYEMAQGLMEDYENYNGDTTPQQIRQCLCLIKSYENGKAHRLFERMKGRRFCADLEGEIRKYRTEKKDERQLLELIREGMELITPGSPCIMQYDYDWAYEESPDFRPAEMSVQIMLTYSVDDVVTDEMKNNFNMDCQESYAITPVTTLYLTPETERLFTMDNYPEKFSKWLNRFIDHVSNNF